MIHTQAGVLLTELSLTVVVCAGSGTVRVVVCSTVSVVACVVVAVVVEISVVVSVVVVVSAPANVAAARSPAANSAANAATFDAGTLRRLADCPCTGTSLWRRARPEPGL